MTSARTMPDSATHSPAHYPGFSTRQGLLRGLLWAAALVPLVVGSTGCTSSLTAIALRDAMKEIAEYGRRGENVDKDAKEALVDAAEPEEMLSLEEALDTAITRLAAVGRLDAEARQMLLETLESTSQEDWPIVIESFASTLEEHAKEAEAIEQVAEQLETEASDGETPAAEAIAVIETPADVSAVAVVETPQPLSAQQQAAATPIDPATTDTTPAEAMLVSGEVEVDVNVEPAVETASAETDPEEGTLTDTEPGLGTPAVATTEVTPSTIDEQMPAVSAEILEETAADADLADQAEPAANNATVPARPTEPLAAETAAPGDLSAGDLSERVTTAIRELPVQQAPVLSPEETMQRLEEALEIARRQAPLRVENPCFAWQVRAWGDVERCELSRFHSGQQVIVYFEVDNLTSDLGPEGHATKLDTELRLVNASGECLHEWSFPPLAEQCPAPRRDYFARYILEVPAGISPGPLRLELTVNDLLGEKSADVALPLEVVGTPQSPDERVASDTTLLR